MTENVRKFEGKQEEFNQKMPMQYVVLQNWYSKNRLFVFDNICGVQIIDLANFYDGMLTKAAMLIFLTNKILKFFGRP